TAVAKLNVRELRQGERPKNVLTISWRQARTETEQRLRHVGSPGFLAINCPSHEGRAAREAEPLRQTVAAGMTISRQRRYTEATLKATWVAFFEGLRNGRRVRDSK